MRSVVFMKSALWHGTRRRARYFQVYLTCFVLFSCCLLSAFTGNRAEPPKIYQNRHGRSLLSTNDTEPPPTEEGLYPEDLFTLEQKRRGAVILHIMGMCYMFLALAIACDEFFVPALSVITEKLAISEDVAGATFMAAGGSAPELFTSFIGTFLDPKSNVGFGTIVGSAVFNVLFVIGMCAIFSRTVLKLTWWPLFRDCLFYSLGLILLIAFFSDQWIDWWESLVLLLCYIVYVTFMKFNHYIEMRVKDLLKSNQVRAVDTEMASGSATGVSKGDLCLEKAVEYFKKNKETPCFRYGALQLVIQTIDPLGEASIAVKAKQLKRISGFNVRVNVKKDQEQHWDLKTSDVVTSDGAVPQDRRFSNSTSNTSSQHGSRTAVNPLSDGEFEPTDTFQVQKFNSLIYQDKHLREEVSSHDSSEKDKQSGRRLSQSSVIINGDLPSIKIEPGKQEGQESNVPGMCCEDGDRRDSVMSKGSRRTVIPDTDGAVEATLDGGEEPLDLSWPKKWKDRIIYLIKAPIIFLMYFTALDCRRPDLRHLYPLTFIVSILWIGGFSYLMVWWATEVGETFGIETQVMGLTFLAAGTSVPDLITSVLVARKGFGDMAVSSSIGSNLFDITIGLPVPWLIYSVAYGTSVSVSSSGLFCSVLLLFVMLVAVVVSIGLSKWRMSKLLGFMMFVLYAVFLVLSLLLMHNVIPCVIELDGSS